MFVMRHVTPAPRAVPPFLASILDITGIGELLARPAAATSDAASA